MSAATSTDRAAAQSESKTASSSTSKAAPLYITIGPQGCGKTTWIKQQHQQQQKEGGEKSGSGSIVDISLDDQPTVYVPIPTELFSASTDAILESKGLLSDLKKLLQTSIFQKAVQQRLLSPENSELRLVVQRLSESISQEDFERSLRSMHDSSANANANNKRPQYQNNATNLPTDHNSDQLVMALMESTRRVMERHHQQQEQTEKKETAVSKLLPKTIDLFIVEALFKKPFPTAGNGDKGNNNNTWTGIELATNILRNTPTNISVAWGNTNTKPRDFATVLEIAQQQGRPVHFCIFDSGSHDFVGSNSNSSSSEQQKLAPFQLPHVGYSQLMDRNIQRFVQTGRYVPSKAIAEASQRVEALIRDAIRQARHHNKGSTEGNNGEITKLDLDRQLARMARFEMRDDRTVKELQDRWNNGRPSAQNNRGRQQQHQNQNQNRRWPSGRSSSSQSQSQSRSKGPSQQHQQQQQSSDARGHENVTNYKRFNWQRPPGNSSNPGSQQESSDEPNRDKPKPSSSTGSDDRNSKRSRREDWNRSKR